MSKSQKFHKLTIITFSRSHQQNKMHPLNLGKKFQSLNLIKTSLRRKRMSRTHLENLRILTSLHLRQIQKTRMMATEILMKSNQLRTKKMLRMIRKNLVISIMKMRSPKINNKVQKIRLNRKQIQKMSKQIQKFKIQNRLTMTDLETLTHLRETKIISLINLIKILTLSNKKIGVRLKQIHLSKRHQWIQMMIQNKRIKEMSHLKNKKIRA